MRITIEHSGAPFAADAADVDLVVDGERYWCGSVKLETPYSSLQWNMPSAYVAKPKKGRPRPFEKQAKAMLWLAERCLVREGLA